MGILRSDRVSGLGGANAIVGSTRFAGSGGGGSGKTVTFFKDSSLAPGTSDFCAEAWVYFNWVDGTNNTQLFANLNGNFGVSNANCWALIRIGAANQFYAWNSSGWQAFGAGAPTVHTWHYIQLVRSSNVFTLYMDGTALPSTVANSQDLTHDEIGLGARDDGSEGLDGFISNFRLTIGSSAAALAGIVPSAASRVLSTDTKLLCCNDPGNVNNEDAQGIPTSTTSDNDVQMIQGFASRFVPDKGEDYGTTFEDNTRFDTLSYMVPPGGTTAQSNRGRAVFGGGESPSADNAMEYINIQSSGRTVDFGDTSVTTPGGTAVSSSTRGVFTLYNTPANKNTLEYITIATTSNATDFGDQSIELEQEGSASNATRGLFAGGIVPPSTANATVEYITIATTGNAADFGDLSGDRISLEGTADTTRAVFGGGIGPASPWPKLNTMEYFTIATTGNATDFGDMTYGSRYPGATGDNTRGVYMGGDTGSMTNIIDYITIQTTANASDFGDLVTASCDIAATSNNIRGIMGAGMTPSRTNTIEQLTIATTGNASDFGDLIRAVSQIGVCSDSHGGIS